MLKQQKKPKLKKKTKKKNVKFRKMLKSSHTVVFLWDILETYEYM